MRREIAGAGSTGDPSGRNLGIRSRVGSSRVQTYYKTTSTVGGALTPVSHDRMRKKCFPVFRIGLVFPFSATFAGSVGVVDLEAISLDRNDCSIIATTACVLGSPPCSR